MIVWKTNLLEASTPDLLYLEKLPTVSKQWLRFLEVDILVTVYVNINFEKCASCII